jgi:nicotinate-nucleotide pyrophosphorylase (carboxylating)
MWFNTPAIAALIDLALQEDIGVGDAATDATVGANQHGEAVVRAKADLIFAGGPIFAAVVRRVDPEVRVTLMVGEGQRVTAGTVAISLQGRLASILLAERTGLNFLSRISGIATATQAAVAAVAHTSCTILDTRKTLPGFRSLDKYAVRAGGGGNHRSALDSGVLLKENHVTAAGGVSAAVRAAKASAAHLLKVEVEIERLDQLESAIAAGADLVMLDNMDLAQMRSAVGLASGRVQLEASGNMTLERLAAVAETGVDFISIGGLTHSVRAADLSLRVVNADSTATGAA